MIIGGSLFFFLYILGGMGAGDVKLAGGVGTLLGSEKILAAIFFTIIFGGIMAIIFIIINYFKRRGNAYSCAIDNHSKKRSSNTDTSKSWQRTIPYGIAISLGTIVTIIIYYKV
jgi:prepilin peptidase CpaA